MKLSYKFLILISIITIAFILRFSQLGSNPPEMTWDEVAWGYNAYSLGIDGRDEFGRFLPINYLESFGDFKPPMYAYLDIIPVKVFGLTAFATRVPSAALGVLTVLMTYFLAIELFYQSKKKQLYGLVSAGVLAISPWHIMLSRAAFEANVATFFIVTGVWLFLYAIRDKKWFLPLSIVSFLCAFYTFNSSRIVAPLLVMVLSIIFIKKLLSMKLQVVLAIVIGIVMILPSITFLLSPQSKLRFQEVNIFSDISVIKLSNQEILNDNYSAVGKLLHNHRIVYGIEFMKHYFDNLTPQFLFISGDGNSKFSIRDMGELYLLELPFLLIGAFFLVRKKEGSWYLIPLWLLLGIIPAATARETPHALRTEVTLPTFQLLISYGLVQAGSLLKKGMLRNWGLGIIGGIYLVSIFFFQHTYWVHYSNEYSSDWQYGYKSAITYAKEHESGYGTIKLTDALGRSYIYYLFYTKTSPLVYRNPTISNITRDTFGFVHVNSIGKYVFNDSVEKRNNGSTILYISLASAVPTHAKKLQTFYLKNGNPILVAYTL